MKTLKEGKPPTGIPVWKGAKFICDVCRGTFQLEENDHVKEISNERVVGGQLKIATPPCPTIFEIRGDGPSRCGNVNVLTLKNDRVPGTESMEQ
jgi:hypothetical protein